MTKETEIYKVSVINPNGHDKFLILRFKAKYFSKENFEQFLKSKFEALAK